MSSEDVTTAVAKRLKYYLDTKRREDAFDLTGPHHPERNQPVLRPGSSLAYEGLHDRSLKHYYRRNDVKQQLQSMKTVAGLNGRERQVRKRLDRTMQEYNYRHASNKLSPYATSLLHPRGVMPNQDSYFKPRKSSRKKKRPNVVVGKTAKVGRRAPDEKVSTYEKERLVNMATKLIVATETIALPQNRKIGRGNQTETSDGFPVLPGSERRASSASDPGPRATPHPPIRKQPSRRAPKKWHDSASNEGSLDSTLDSVRSQMQHIKLDSSGGAFSISHNHASPRMVEQKQMKFRPKSAGDKLSQNHDDSDYDDFYDRSSSHVSPMTPVSGAWKADATPQAVVDSSTQTVETKGTQTAVESEKAHNDRITKDLLDSPKQTSFKGSVTNPVQGENTGSQTNEIEHVSEAVQTSRTLLSELENTVVSYEVFVGTGDKLGAGTSSEVKLIIFGELGDSGERPLLRSKSNTNPFARRQVDLFIVDSMFLGNIKSIRIGHNGTALGTGWFLDRIIIREGKDSPRAFEFKCERWLSARDDDGQIVRDLPLSNQLQGHEVPRVTEARRTFFKHRPDSASSQEGSHTLPFRPLSAKKRRDSAHQSETVAKDNREKDDGKSTRKFFPPKSLDTSSDEEDSNDMREKKGAIEKEDDGPGLKKKSSLPEHGNVKEKGEKVEIVTEKKENSDVETMKRNLENKNETKRRKKERKGKDDKKYDEDAKRQNEETVDDVPSGKKAEEEKLYSEQSIEERVEEDDAGDRKREDGAQGKENEDTNDLIGVKEAKKKNNEEDKSSDSSDSESSSSESEMFSVSSGSSDSDESEEESEKSDAEDEEEEDEVERVPKDTSKKEESDDESRKKSAQDDYMAGFLAGVRANEQDTPKVEEATESVLTTGLNIHQASESGDFERFKELINEVPELKNKPDERGWTPLHIVTAFGHLEILKWLTVNGVNLPEETPTGFTAIHLAAMNGHVKCIMVLAAMGCPISCSTVDESTPLHLAAMSGHVECVKWLLANRANPGLRDSNERTPLDLAVEYQHESCIELLQLMVSELKRKDSIVSKLRFPNRKESENPVGSSKGTDSGLGGTESGEDGWISDVEEDIIGRGDRVPSSKTRSQSLAMVRKKSKQEERAIEEMEEKRQLYEKQRNKMERRESSFLDSIRQEVDSDDNEEF